jgi:hypothetical protein
MEEGNIQEERRQQGRGKKKVRKSDKKEVGANEIILHTARC